MPPSLRRLIPDPFLLALLACVATASLLPCRGQVAVGFSILTAIAIGILFFMHGVRLSREAVVAGLLHWRLHLVILLCTFALYPLLGLAFQALFHRLLPPAVWTGVIFVCLLPSTVQSSIAYVSLARGNVAAAVCAATASSLLGLVITPVLVALALSVQGGGVSGDQVIKIGVQILLPFAVGHLLRPWLGAWAARHKKLLTISDRSSILLAVYTAFSAAMIQGVWRQLSPQVLIVLLVIEAALLACVLVATTVISRVGGFNKADEIAIVFCGSKKSLASGIPMANVLFPAAMVGPVVVPLMIFHQMQLMVAAVLARRYAARDEVPVAAAAEVAP